MTLNPEYEKTALVLLPRTPADTTVEDLALSMSRPYLIDAVRQRGVDVVLARGSSSFNQEDGTIEHVLRPDYSSDYTSVTMKEIGKRSLEEFGVVRSITGPIRTDIQTPFLNPQSIRDLGVDKHGMLSEVLQPANIYNRTAILLHEGVTPSIIADAIAAIPGDFVVAKPNGGQLSRGIYVGSKQDVTQQVVALLDKSQSKLAEPYIIEEMLDFSTGIPDIRGMNGDQQDRLNYANQMGVNKELRMYYFGNGVWDTVGRVAKPGETDFRADDWLYLDPESIPESVMAGGEKVVNRLHEKTGTDEFNIAIDWIHAGSASHADPNWQVMEVNAAVPELVGLDLQDEVGRRQHNKLADQISRIAIR